MNKTSTKGLRFLQRLMGLILLMGIFLAPVFSQGVDEQSSASTYASYSGQTVPLSPIVASTSWVAAMARAAGAKRITVLAPIELRHPPEYDFRPGDIIAATQAQWIIWAGYEGFIKNLIAAAQINQEKVILATTKQHTACGKGVGKETRTTTRYIGFFPIMGKRIELTRSRDDSRNASLWQHRQQSCGPIPSSSFGDMVGI